MRTAIRRIVAILACGTVLPLYGCGSDLQDSITSPTRPSTGNTATVTFWTSDSSPSSIAVVLDGTQVGVLSAYRVSAPVCGSSSNGAVTVTVAAGTHTFSAREITDHGVWGPSNFSLTAGQCLNYELTP